LDHRHRDLRRTACVRAVIVWMKRYLPSDGTYSLAAPDGHLLSTQGTAQWLDGH
jgi:hypothetical protein